MGIIKIDVTQRGKVYYQVNDGDRRIVMNQQDTTIDCIGLEDGIYRVI
ncbi:MAG: hypothetical protein PHW00_01075 [Clostridia bacterium]|nr:hypothetical protein [Clostridia bacterium]